MFHSGENIDESRFNIVKKVETDADLEIFLTTFDQCYRKDDPMNPYGELGYWLKVTRIAWQKHHVSNKIAYFIVYKENDPVAVSALTNHKQIGYISNVGSKLSVRGEGFGKLATMYCVAQSKKNGNNTHCLATEEGTNPNSFYKSLGFKTKFTAKLMVRKSA
jgi:ribosomal protein S18 acetylase RimI-like enzyme